MYEGEAKWPLDVYEGAVVRLFEYCGFRYDPGELPDPKEFYAAEMLEIPYQEFEQRVVSGYWVRTVALHLGDARTACNDVSEYVRLIPRYLKYGHKGMRSEWLDEYLPVPVSDELRFHVFCFLTLSETIRDKIRSNQDGRVPHLIPDVPVRRHRPPVWAKALSKHIALHTGLPEPNCQRVARQLSRLGPCCAQLRDAIDVFASPTEDAMEAQIQAFSNVQATMLEMARLLIEADYAVDVWAECPL